MQTVEQLNATAIDVETRYQIARERYALLVNREAELSSQKPLEKEAAVYRVIAAAEARGNKVSYTAAERTVEADPAYSEFLATLRDVITEKVRAKTQAKAAAMEHARIAQLLRNATQEVGT